MNSAPLSAEDVRTRLDLAARCGAEGELSQAEALYRSVVDSEWTSASALAGLAGVLGAAGRQSEAVTYFEQSLKLASGDPQTLNNYGSALLALERGGEAARAYERAVALEPSYAAAWHNLGLCLTMLGRLDKARQALEQASALTPLRGEYHRSLALAAPFHGDDPRLVAMESAAATPALSQRDRIELHFGLGKAYSDLARLSESLDQLLAGNALIRAATRYDEAATLAGFARIAAVFTAETLAAKAVEAPSGPVFIVGMPRAGTTLVEQMLANHSAVHGAGERIDLPRIVAEFGAGFPERLRSLAPADLRAMGERYLAAVRPSAPEVLRITDKMPANFRYLGLIAWALPGARVIHVRRDPVDTCMSCFSTLFRGNQPYAYDLAELGRYYRGYERLMEHWRASLLPGVMIEVRYEDLIADPEPVLRQMLSHLALGWDDACLRFHQSSRPVSTASAVQVRRPLYDTSVGRWRRHRERLAPLLSALAGGA